MKLEDIGFYTLSDRRCNHLTPYSDLQRCELILTDRCNFNCAYCRGVKDKDKGDMTYNEAKQIVDMWCKDGLKNIRFSGGEPTLWPGLSCLCLHAHRKDVERIAISSNGSAPIELYEELIDCGVNDFSISLDACCASTGNKMAGRTNVWDKIITNIRLLSKLTYVTVGVVLTDDNYHELNDIIAFASDLGVADIRVIPAAQVSTKLKNLVVEDKYLDKHPILRYRYNNFINNKPVRGLNHGDIISCPLVLDDMAVLKGYHYPCIIYMREQGDPIGKMEGRIEEIRRERFRWYINHNTSKDPICSQNCLDVCVAHNNKCMEV
jgi:MoaA/NifB/PqqE/SkfB family radical SAM enzyme